MGLALSVRRVLAAQGLELPAFAPRPAKPAPPIPDWVRFEPNRIWIVDVTHFPRARAVAFAIEDVVSRRWIATLVSSEETSTQLQAVFTEALEAEGLAARVARRLDASVDPSADDASGPILLAMSDNGPQMTSGSTREFMALCAIAQRFGRPGTPADQAWIESLFGHVKAEWPHLEAIRDRELLRRELAAARGHYNGVRLHAGIG